MNTVQLLENHWLACMASAGGGGRVTRVPGTLVVSNERVPAAFLNFIALRGVDSADLRTAVELGCAVLAGLGREPCLFLSPAAGEMGALSCTLATLGWRCSTRQSVLVRELPAAGLVPPPEVDVTEIGPLGLSAWGRLLVRAYEVEPAAGRAVRAGWTALMTQPGEGAQARFYRATIGGSPVGTGLTWIQGQVAGLYCGAVLPGFRRLGAERATVIRRMGDAALAGAAIATLQVEAGSPVEHLCVDRLGFRLAYRREVWVLAVN